MLREGRHVSDLEHEEAEPQRDNRLSDKKRGKIAHDGEARTGDAIRERYGCGFMMGCCWSPSSSNSMRMPREYNDSTGPTSSMT